MVLIDFGDFKLRFDPKDIRINIDGEIIDVGVARRDLEEQEGKTIDLGDGTFINTKRPDTRFIKKKSDH